MLSLFYHSFLAAATILAANPQNISASNLTKGEKLGEIVSINGVVATTLRDQFDSRYNWMILRTRDGKFCAAVPETTYSLNRLNTLKDSEVQLTGVVQRYERWRRFLGYQLSIRHEADIKVLQPAPEDPFSASLLTDNNTPHRQTMTGTVCGVTSEQFFIRTREERFLPVQPSDVAANQLPKVGDKVTVAGFADSDNVYYRMNEAIVRIDTPAKTPLPEDKIMSLSDILINIGDEQFLNPDANGSICRIRGTVTSATGEEHSRFQTLDVDRQQFTVDTSGLKDLDMKHLSKGSVVEITGLCYASFENDRTTIVFPRFRGLLLIPRYSSDIRIIKPAPWWTPTRSITVIGILIAVILLFICWVIALRYISTRRARLLAHEQIASARAELKVEERTKLAVELHDSISQVLTGVALQIDAAVGADGSSAQRFLATARNMLASCRQELSGCLWDLRSRTFEEKDMTEAVQRTLTPHIGNAHLYVRFNVPRERLSEASAHAVLRIIRELATNAIRHGKANNIRIAGEVHDQTISFSVQDDGCGFDPATAPGPAQGHFGLQGVRERLNDFNGTIQCDSTPGYGAKFTVVLNMPDEETE